MELVSTFAGIAWDPEIRGALTVLTGAVVLFGSVWLIVATNVGGRLSTLVSLAGFFAWMVIMAGYWWVVSPNAYIGDNPSWEIIDVNVGDLDDSALPQARDLTDREDLIDEFGTPYEIVLESGNEVALTEFDSQADTTGLDPEAAERAVEDQQIRNEQTNLSEIEGVTPEVIDAAGLDFQEWTLLSSAEAGEAQATASAFLLESELGFETAGDFIFLETYDLGGKPRLPEDPSRWDRIRHWITNSLRITHPTHYAVVQVQATIDKEQVPGQPPPVPEADPEAEVVSVIMVRDLGDRRFPAAMVTIGSLLIFLVLCYVLHIRDKELMRRRADFEAGKA